MKTFTINGVTKTFHEWHMELWNWLADNPTKNKLDFFDEHECDLTPKHFCFACESANWKLDDCGDEFCSNCPINWGKSKPFACEYCEDDNDFLKDDEIALYKQWRDEESKYKDEKDLKNISILAKQIANLPWNEMEEY